MYFGIPSLLITVGFTVTVGLVIAASVLLARPKSRGRILLSTFGILTATLVFGTLANGPVRVGVIVTGVYFIGLNVFMGIRKQQQAAPTEAPSSLP